MSKRKNCFWNFYCISQMCRKCTTFWKKRWVSYPHYFRNLWIRMRGLLKCLNGLASEHHSVINVLMGSKHCSNHNGTTINLLSLLLELNWVGKKSALVMSEILRLFVNTLTSDDKYSCRDIQNFPQQFQTPLSEKEKPFCGFFIVFLKCAWKVERF